MATPLLVVEMLLFGLLKAQQGLLKPLESSNLLVQNLLRDYKSTKLAINPLRSLCCPANSLHCLNDVADIVLIPREEPSSDPTQPPKLTFDERPLEDFTTPPEDVPPPDPTKLPPGTAADRDEGASGTAGEKGAAGGLTGLEEQRRKERDATISRIIEKSFLG
jgi:hypothetical protein